MSSRLLRVLAVAAISIGCGSGGEGEGGPLPSPFAAGTTPAIGGGGDRVIGTGTDRGGGSDRGGGATPAIGGGSSSGASSGVTFCTQNSDCGPGGTCSRRDATGGFCFYQCTLPAGSVVGTSAECPGGYMCVRPSQGSVALCLLPCETSASCPFLAGLTAVCSRVSTSDNRYCAWISPEEAN